MRKCVQNLPSGKEIKPMQTIKSKTTRDDKKMNRHLKNKTNETKTRSRRVILLLLLLSTLFWAAGCEDYYSSSPGYYGPGLYDAGSVDFLGHDRLYYRGPGYWNGSAYYVWTPGYWAFRTGVSPGMGPGLAGPNGALGNPGQLLWIHGRYIARGY
jgi:hypothetical protein